MVRASLLLKNTRLEKGLEINEIAHSTKIRSDYIEAIESENINQIPPEPYSSLIIKDYAQFLGLNGQDVLSLFRRDFDHRRQKSTSRIASSSFNPQVAYSVFVVLVVISLCLYLVFEYLKYNQPPNLVVSWPNENTLVSDVIELNGKTNSEATVRINQDLVVVDLEGNFSKKIPLKQGETKITIESKSPSGKTTQVEKFYKR